MDTPENIEHVVALLEQANERLLDASMALLSEALDRGDQTRPEAEKRVTKARRAIERALQELRGINTD